MLIRLGEVLKQTLISAADGRKQHRPVYVIIERKWTSKTKLKSIVQVLSNQIELLCMIAEAEIDRDWRSQQWHVKAPRLTAKTAYGKIVQKPKLRC